MNFSSTVLFVMMQISDTVLQMTANFRYSPGYYRDYRKVSLKFEELSLLHSQSSDKYYRAA